MSGKGSPAPKAPIYPRNVRKKTSPKGKRKNVSNQDEIPGLVVESKVFGHKSEIVAATKATIEELRSQGLIEKCHWALCSLALDQARILERAMADSRIRLTALTGLMTDYRETMQALPQPDIAARGKFEEFLDLQRTAIELAA